MKSKNPDWWRFVPQRIRKVLSELFVMPSGSGLERRSAAEIFYKAGLLTKEQLRKWRRR